jgi:hypothetical protein
MRPDELVLAVVGLDPGTRSSSEPTGRRTREAPARRRRWGAGGARQYFRGSSTGDVGIYAEPQPLSTASAPVVALSTYLGHLNIRSTYWYLEATPEMMTGIATAAEMLVGSEAP